jgi:hypothetical protein
LDARGGGGGHRDRRASHARATGRVRSILLRLLDFFISLGLYIEYIDNVGRAETDGFTPYLGPGFFVALAATAVFIAAGVFAWRERDG